MELLLYDTIAMLGLIIALCIVSLRQVNKYWPAAERSPAHHVWGQGAGKEQVNCNLSLHSSSQCHPSHLVGIGLTQWTRGSHSREDLFWSRNS